MTIKTRNMKRALPVVSCIALLLATQVVWAGDRHVVELFTSQGCSSCPAAERLLGGLDKSRDDVIVLAFHVDYWDNLVHGLAGAWRDPFSDPAWSERQRRYDRRGLAGRNGVYTPQAVVNGEAAAVGSDEAAIQRLLSTPAPRGASLALARGPATLRVTVSGGTHETAQVWLYRFDLHNVTRIEAGENKGMTLTSRHVVRQAAHLGAWEGGDRTYTADLAGLGRDQGCVVVVQQVHQGAVLGAARCPS